jgi:hypothetical protein
MKRTNLSLNQKFEMLCSYRHTEVTFEFETNVRGVRA